MEKQRFPVDSPYHKLADYCEEILWSFEKPLDFQMGTLFQAKNAQIGYETSSQKLFWCKLLGTKSYLGTELPRTEEQGYENDWKILKMYLPQINRSMDSDSDQPKIKISTSARILAKSWSLYVVAILLSNVFVTRFTIMSGHEFF